VPRKRLALALSLLSGLSVLGAIGPSTAAATGELSALQSDLSHQLALAGPQNGAYVYDLTANQVLFSERAAVLRAPASVEKLYTAATVLARFGPQARLTTTVTGVGHLATGGIWEGNLYLRGEGDPTFGSSSFIRGSYAGKGASVSSLASQLLRVDGIHRINGSIMGDETYLDFLRGEPSSGYAPDPFLEGTLSGLSFDRGARGSERGRHAPAAYAARRLWAALKGIGVKIQGRSGAAPTPAGAVALAQVQSPTIAQLTGLMLPPSDNFFAETLLKDLGARFGGAGTTPAGAGVVSQSVAGLFGAHPRIVDGSGLSPADQTSPLQVGELLVALASNPIGSVLRESLAVAGRSGTLKRRMRHTGAAGRCQGKTGTLSGVSNLVGYCQSAGGHLLAFAFFTDGIGTLTAHTFQDHMAITIAGY
jgi:D-alanyl-D-alanine carboxypeptidase/D-alanyl-D-alanine-endopeptidase (penicillin-binding protein 4)